MTAAHYVYTAAHELSDERGDDVTPVDDLPTGHQEDSPLALQRMERGDCPECGWPEFTHRYDDRFWVPDSCYLVAGGVRERIDQYRAEVRSHQRNA